MKGNHQMNDAKDDRDEKNDIKFCKGGGCTAKLGAGALSRVLGMIPKRNADENLIVGYDSSDDAAVYRISPDTAMIHTLDFFPPMVEDPYTFGQIAAANALSDVFAMGGRVVTALNIVCFPEDMDLNVLGRIMQGGAEKVAEAGGMLAGGHSINDSDVKYGLSVTGMVHPDRIYRNDTAAAGDALVLTKKLGTGIICTTGRIGQASGSAMREAIDSMTTLNRKAAEISRSFAVNACTDVTGFGLLGHLHEMMGGRLSCTIDAGMVPVMKSALQYADEFYITAAGQRNRNHVGAAVAFDGIPFSMEEVLFDPQTSGGLLLALDPAEAEAMAAEMRDAGLPAAVIGRVTEKGEHEITVRKSVLTDKQESLIVTFASTAMAMAMEKACRGGTVPGRLIPVPGFISAGCGLAWCAAAEDESAIRELMEGKKIVWQEIRHDIF